MMPILVTSIISVVSVPLYFRFLGDEMYAIWFYVGTLTGAFGFMDLGMGVAAGRYMGVAMGRGDQKAVEEYWATSHVIVFPFVLFFAFVFVVVGAFFAPEWFKLAGSDAATLRWAILWGGIGLFFSYYGQMWNVLAQAHLDFKYLSILRTWTGIASTLGTVAVALLSRNVAVIMAYTTALGLLQFVLLYFRGNNHYKLPLKISHFRKSRLIEMLPYTSKAFAQLISGSVLGSLDRIFLGRLAPAADFAAFGVSQNIGNRVAGLSVAIMGPVFHNTTRGVGGDETKKPADVYRESFAFMFPCYSLVIIGVFFWAGPVTELWLGPKYGPAVGAVFPWIIAALCLNAISNISISQTGGLDRVGTLAIFHTIASLLSLAGVTIGWHFGQMTGAAIGFALSRLIWFVQDMLVRKWIGVKMSEYLDSLQQIVVQFLIVLLLWFLTVIFHTSGGQTLFFAFLSGIAGAAASICILKGKAIRTSNINE
jgi:O-antigen/teichoic acid export membrane protein